MPLQNAEGYKDGDTTFSRLTMAGIDPQSKIMWAHWVCTFLYLGWTLLLLEYHYKEYVALRCDGMTGWGASLGQQPLPFSTGPRAGEVRCCLVGRIVPTSSASSLRPTGSST